MAEGRKPDVRLRKTSARAQYGTTAVWGSAIVLGACLIFALVQQQPSSFERHLKIGFRDTPPDQFRDKNGNPTGTAVELVKEAARRKGIKLEWVYTPAGPEKPLSDGTVDLWPILADTAERRRILYISAPWTKMSFIVAFPESSPLSRLEDLAGQNLAVANISIHRRIAHRELPGAKVLVETTQRDVLQAVCEGAAKGGL